MASSFSACEVVPVSAGYGDADPPTADDDATR
jgi:hypothetical protein